MRFHRFYIKEKIGSKKELTIDSPSVVNQIRRVFRLGVGDEVIVFDGSGNDYECEIKDEARSSLTLVVGEARPSRYMPEHKVILYQSIIKKDKFEWVVEKATELGVTDIVPLLAERSEKKSLNMERLNRIAIEASEQSGRGDVPVVHSSSRGLGQVFTDDVQKYGLKSITSVVFHTEGQSRLHFYQGPLAIFIGPEGGWSPEEIKIFQEAKIEIARLGKQILRSETASISALSKALL